MKMKRLFTPIILALIMMGIGSSITYYWTTGRSDGGGMKMSPSSAGSGESVPKKGKKVLYWKSSMVAGEIHQEPGKDSMGMDLVPVYEGDDVGPGSIRIDPATRQNMGVRLGAVTEGTLVKSVRTVGFIDYDETTLAVVTTKVDGWVEKLYVDETGSQVHMGDNLFDLYSPELFSAQEEYLVALRNVQKYNLPNVTRSKLDSENLVRDAKTRLEYFDIPDNEIRELETSGKVKKTLTLHAPNTGIVIHKNIVEGQMVKAGSDLFRIADLSKIWVMGKVYEYDLPYVKEGQVALMTLSYLPGQTFKGRVTYVYPYLEKGTREVSVRMEFYNPGYYLKPGMYATMTLRAEIAKDVTLVPDVAVINTGARSVVFVGTSPGHFELREIKTGIRSEGNKLQVLSGLEPGEQVVLSGQFLLDSESRLREAALKFLEPNSSETKAGELEPIAKANPEKGAAGNSDSDPSKAAPGEGHTYFACPMPEHSSILYDAPGDCPICGKSMKLIPVQSTMGVVPSASNAGPSKK